jgi:hypothetical protein
LQSEALRREIQEGLNVIESWNSANGFIFFGKGGELGSNRSTAKASELVIRFPRRELALLLYGRSLHVRDFSGR